MSKPVTRSRVTFPGLPPVLVSDGAVLAVMDGVEAGKTIGEIRQAFLDAGATSETSYPTLSVEEWVRSKSGNKNRFEDAERNLSEVLAHTAQ